MRFRTPSCGSPPRSRRQAAPPMTTAGSGVLAPNFRSSNCRVTVTDGATSVQVALDECTPTTPTPATADDDDRRRPRRPRRRPPTTTTTTTAADDDHDDPRRRPPPRPRTTDHDDHHDDHDDHDDHCHRRPRRRPTTTVPTKPLTFTDLHDLVPHRCFIAALSTVGVASVRSGSSPVPTRRRGRTRRASRRPRPSTRGA